MSIRSILRAALAGIAKLVLVPVEIVAAGVRSIVHMLVPARNTGLDDAAEVAIVEEGADDAQGALQTIKASKAHVRRPQTDRIRSAAADLRGHRPVSAGLLDPSRAAEAEILEWLMTLDDLQLGMIVKAHDSEIADHIRGDKKLRMPMPKKFEIEVEARREASRPLTRTEWVRELMRLAAEEGNEDLGPDDLDAFTDEADALVEARATLSDYRPTPRAAAMDRVIDDREEVG